MNFGLYSISMSILYFSEHAFIFLFCSNKYIIKVTNEYLFIIILEKPLYNYMVFACYHKVIFFHAEKSQKKDEDKDGVLYTEEYILIYIF